MSNVDKEQITPQPQNRSKTLNMLYLLSRFITSFF